MEVIFESLASIKIKARNVTFCIDPSSRVDEDAVVIYTKETEENNVSARLEITGPGEYEAGGVSLRGERMEGGLLFDVLDGNERLLFLSSPKIAKRETPEEYNAIVVRMDEKVGDDVVSQLSGGTMILYGDQAFLPSSPLRRESKINLRKQDIQAGQVIYLTR